MRRSLLICVCLPLALSACATTGGAGAGTVASASASTSPRLTRDEIEAANLPTAYDVVDRLRRSWLRRDARTGNAVSVVLDNSRAGGAEALRDISTAIIGEIQFVTSDEATRRWPGQVNGTAIVITRRR